jgi:hypothetical protein
MREDVAGIGVALGASGGEPSIAHVLPLTGGDLRTRLVPQATAAVFITRAEAKPAANLQPVADNFASLRRKPAFWNIWPEAQRWRRPRRISAFR